MKLNILTFLWLMSLASSSTYGQKYDSTYGKPLIVLTETDPWLMVIGSDVPTFALYEKGQVIYKAIENKRLRLYEAVLNKEELQQLIQSFSISDSIYHMRDDIVASLWTDQPSNILTINLTQEKTTSIYGRLRNDGEARKIMPLFFLTIYDNIIKYKNSSAVEWIPKKIEIMFWNYNYALNKRPWIKGFPDLNSPTTIKFNDDSYSVFIDKKDFDQFKKFYNSLGQREAVKINERKMAISYRFPFPNINIK